MAGTRPGGRPASAVRWRREASTDHSHEGGADTVDAFPFTLQDHGPRHPRRVATTCGPGSTAKLRNTRVLVGAENPVTSCDSAHTRVGGRRGGLVASGGLSRREVGECGPRVAAVG